MIQPARSHPPLVIYGAGGHGRVVADAADTAGLTVLGHLDDAPATAARPGIQLLNPDDPRLATAHHLVAIGDNAVRRSITLKLREAGRQLANVLHPDATVSDRAGLEAGIYVGARAVVGPAVRLGEAVLINTGAIVEHECHVAAAAHIAPGAVLGGGVTVEAGALVGLGARVLPGLTVGAHAVIGAGAVLTRDAEPGAVYRGVPARKVR